MTVFKEHITFKILLSILVIGIQLNLSAAELTIKVKEIKSNHGKLMIAIFDNEQDYKRSNYRNAYASIALKARRGEQSIRLYDLPHGKYAISLFHDDNNNEKLDMGRSNLPAEGYGTSKARNKMQTLTFKEAALGLGNSPKSIEIELFYW